MRIARAVPYVAGIIGLSFLFAGSVQAGISGSKHDLSTTGIATNKLDGSTSATDNNEICVFCHTPHSAMSTSSIPLWNRALSSGSAYTTYTSATTDGTTVLSGDSTSLACLTCHDGSMSLDYLVNAPGTGFGAGGVDTAGENAFGFTGATDNMDAAVAANFGTDFSNDHPIAIQYCGGGITDGGGACTGDTAFNAPTLSGAGATAVWYFDMDTSGGLSAADVRAFARDAVTAGTFEPFVECASCHDPHNDTAAGGVSFMRAGDGTGNSGSKICLACHNK